MKTNLPNRNRIILCYACWLTFLAVGNAAAQPSSSDLAQDAYRSDFKAAYQALNEDQPERTIELLEPLSGGQALDDLADYLLIQAYFKQKEYEKLVSLADKLLGRLSQEHLAYKTAMYRAMALLRLGKSDQAIKAYRTIGQQFPEKEPDKLLMRLGQALEEAGEFRQAERSWQKIVWLYPKSSYSKAALSELKQMRLVHRLKMTQPDANLLYETINAHQSAGKLTNACDYSRNFLSMYLADQRAEEVRATLVELLVKRNLGAEARAELQKIKRSPPGEKNWSARRDYLYTMAGKSAEKKDIRQDLIKMGQRHPGNAWASQALDQAAGAYWDDGQYAEAAKYYARSFADYPRYDKAAFHCWRAGWGHYLSQDMDRAAVLLDKSADLQDNRQDRAQSLYWAARAYQQLGKNKSADRLYQKLTAEDPLGYYAFCAEQRLTEIGGQTSSFPIGPAGIEARLKTDKTMQGPMLPVFLSAADAIWQLEKSLPSGSVYLGRIKELLTLEIRSLAAVEIGELQRLSKDDSVNLAAVSYLYHEAGEALESVKIANELYNRCLDQKLVDPGNSLIRLRMPLDFWSLVKKYSEAHGFDPHFICAIIRQESVFDPRSHSRASARGLMQVIPATGKRIAKELSVPDFKQTDLHDPETSIRFGTYYLATVRERFEGDLVAALAGYNAGPGRPARWWPELTGRPLDEVIERIPFSETRGYVKNILRNYEIYRHWYSEFPGALAPTKSIFSNISEPLTPLPKNQGEAELY